MIDVPGVEVRVVERCSSTNSVLLAQSPANRCCLRRKNRPRAAASAAAAGTARRAPALTFSLSPARPAPARELASLSLVAGSPPPARCARSGRRRGGQVAERPRGRRRQARRDPGRDPPPGARRARSSESASTAFAVRAWSGASSARWRRSSSSSALRAMPSSARSRARCEALERFEPRASPPRRPEWEAMDAHAGQHLRVRLADGRTLSRASAPGSPPTARCASTPAEASGP